MSASLEPVPFEVYEADVYQHGTKAELAVGDLVLAGVIVLDDVGRAVVAQPRRLISDGGLRRLS
jgi:hypothetical protein